MRKSLLATTVGARAGRGEVTGYWRHQAGKSAQLAEPQAATAIGHRAEAGEEGEKRLSGAAFLWWKAAPRMPSTWASLEMLWGRASSVFEIEAHMQIEESERQRETEKKTWEIGRTSVPNR